MAHWRASGSSRRRATLPVRLLHSFWRTWERKSLRSKNQSAAIRLASEADVLIQNFRPGVMEKRGLGYNDIKKLNSKIVYCSISGFGPTGPYRDMPGYDTVGQARSGLLSLLTDPGKPQGMGISFSDHLTGMYACYGVLG